jgi:hypothetical protein
MRSRGIRSCVALAICLGAVACRSARDVAPEPSKEVARLGQLLGKWRSKSHHLARSIASAVPDTDLTFTCMWTEDKNYLACSQTGQIGKRQIKEVDVFGYSKQDKLYSMLVLLDIENAPPQVYANWFTWEGDTWRFLPRNGVRSTWQFKTPDYHVTRTERSDDGKHWNLASSGEHTRVY